jgi:hypothetical protein
MNQSEGILVKKQVELTSKTEDTSCVIGRNSDESKPSEKPSIATAEHCSVLSLSETIFPQ